MGRISEMMNKRKKTNEWMNDCMGEQLNELVKFFTYNSKKMKY